MVFLRLCRLYSKNTEKVEGEDMRARARIADKFACGSGAEEVRRNMAKAADTGPMLRRKRKATGRRRHRARARGGEEELVR